VRLDGFTIEVRTPGGDLAGTVDKTSSGWIWRCALPGCNEHGEPTWWATDDLLKHLVEDHPDR
jgi:hypothetical protein